MIAIILLLLACAPFLWWYSVLKKFKAVDSIPGPTPLPIVGNAIQIGNSPQQLLHNLLKFRRQFGDLYKIYIANELRVVIANPDLTEKILSSNIHITKSNAYDRLVPWLGRGLLISTGKKWKSRRRIITPTLHFKILEQFIDVFNGCSNTLVEKLSTEVGKNSCDIYPFINLFSLDVICESSMGVKVHAQQGQNTEYVEAVRDYLDVFINRSFSSWKRYDFLFSLSSNYPSYLRCLKILHNFTNNVIRQRRLEKSSKKVENNPSDDGIKRKVALLDMLLECEESNGLSNEDIREEVDTFMFEGHDTTTSGVAFAIYCLADNQNVQEKVYDEIKSVFGEEKHPKIAMKHLQEVKYLEMFLKEVQRLYPSVPLFERLIENDSIIDNYKLPKDAFVSLFVYAQQRDPKFFPDPEKFDPERFTAENQAKRHNYAHVPFSAGPRNCVGQKFAMLEMKSAIITLVRNFKFLPVPNFKPDLGITGILKSFNGVCVRLEKRDT